MCTNTYTPNQAAADALVEVGCHPLKIDDMQLGELLTLHAEVCQNSSIVYLKLTPKPLSSDH